MQKKIVCILGMHRSGSSYVAGRIRGMGIDLGNDNELIAGDDYNERGYQENKDLSYLGEDILVAFGGDHIHPPFLEPGWENSILLDSFKAQAKYLVDTKFGKSPTWGWKDPRNSLLLPFWKQIVLPTHYIITIRNPLAVAESLLRRNDIAIRHGSELWFLHIASAMFHTRDAQRKLIFFEDACHSPLQLDQELKDFLSLDHRNDATLDHTLIPEFDDSLVHHRQTDERVYASIDIHPLAKALYRTLRDLRRSNHNSGNINHSLVPTATQEHDDLSVLHIIETQPSLVINPWSLPNCFSLKPKINEYSIAEREKQNAALSHSIVERDEQIARLSHAVTERDSKIHHLNQILTERADYIDELNSVIEQTRRESESLFARLEILLQSKSWKLTRPLRGFSRLARQTIPFRPPKQIIYRLAKIIGRTLPIPWRTKIKYGIALRNFAYSAPANSELSTQLLAENKTLKGNDWNAEIPDRQYQEMRAECCGLEAELVSVVLPVFNQANLLRESIESVLAQTYTKFELIIINDGSTDGVEAIFTYYASNPRVKVYSQPNQKLPKALSNGFTYARGAYWTWTSADNLMEPMMLELLVRKLQQEPSVGMVYADYLAINDKGEILKDATWRAHNRPNPSSGEIRLPRSVKNLNTVQDNFIGPCFMYRGWIGRCIGEYDPQLGVEDYDYWMRINAFFKVSHLGEETCLYRYRVHDNTLSANAHKHRIHEKLRGLMTYEKERAVLYKAPITYAVDKISFEWLVSCGVDQCNMRNIEDSFNPPVPQSTLIIIGISTVEKYLDLFSQIKNPVVVILNDGAADYVKLKCLPSNSAILVYNKRTAARVRLVSDFPIFDAASAQAHKAVIAFYKNTVFVSSMRKKEERYRVPPEKLFSKDKNVLLQVDNFTQGGMENVVIDLAISLKKLGFKVSIVILGKEGDAAVKAREQNLDVTSFGSPPTRASYENYLKNKNIGLVNAHFSVYGAEICSALDIPFLQTIHNSYVWFEPEATAKYQHADSYTTAYICVSATAARYADVVLGLDISKMKVISNGIDPNAVDHINFKDNRESLRKTWKVNSESLIFLNVASIIAPKAQLPLINAFSELLKTVPLARLVLLGSVMEFSYQREIEKQIAALGIHNNVVLAGYDRNAAKYYHAADVFVLPSYWEGWSLSLGEAMANGLSCVITDVGSSYEFYGNERIEIIQPPFGDITKLNFLNLSQYVYCSNTAFEKQLANAMIKASGKPRLGIDEYLRKKLDREAAYKDYALFFSEVEYRNNAKDYSLVEQ